MKKFRILTIILLAAMLLTACGGQNGDSKNENPEALAQIPEAFPLATVPVFQIEETVSFTDTSVADVFSAKLVYNSNGDYASILEFYGNEFPNAITKDFGNSYHMLVVPDENTPYLINMLISSTLSQGERGVCTVDISVTEQ